MKVSSVALALALGLAASASQASSHREAPAISRMPALDSTDFYVFRSYESGREGFVTLLANYIPLQDAYGGPNYFTLDPKAVYAIKIDNDGDAVEDLTFEFRFAESTPAVTLPIGDQSVAVPLKHLGALASGNTAALNFHESYSLSLVTGAQRSGNRTKLGDFTKPYDFVGLKTFGSADAYSQYARQYIAEVSLPGCASSGRVFVGQRKDPFVVNLGETFDLVNYVPVEGDSAPGAGDGGGFPGGISQSSDNDDLKDKNVTTLALELPISCVVGSGNGVIGAWTTASLPQARILNPGATFAKANVQGGALVQVSRLSNPLVNELVIGLADKDRFSSSEPKDDAQFATYVTNPTLPAILDLLFRDAVNSTLGTSISNLAPSNLPRTDLVAAFLTGFAGVNQQATVTPSEMLRLNTAIAPKAAAQQSAFGVAGDDLAGFPNGRRPGDDVVDIALRVVMGRLCYPIPVGGVDTDLGLCTSDDAPVGNVAFTDGAPLDASMIDSQFPYLKTPVAGSPN